MERKTIAEGKVLVDEGGIYVNNIKWTAEQLKAKARAQPKS